MKKLITILFSAVLLSLFSVTAFAAEFDPSLTVNRSTEGIILVEIADDKQTNEVLAEKWPSLTIDCDWDTAKLLASGSHMNLEVSDGKITFAVSHGGTYVITNQPYSVDKVDASCTVDGKYIYTVGRNTYEEVIPATGHDFKNIHRRTCENCSEPNPDYVPPYIPPVVDDDDPTPDPIPVIPVNPFFDIPTNAYYYDAVLWAVENEITNGTSTATFNPDMACTRAQAVTFLWRAAGSPEPVSYTIPFEDVAAGAFYYKAVLWALETGITNGTSATTFSPNADCTRAQIVTFLWRSQQSPANTAANPFADVAADAYYAKAVLWALENEITNGTSDTSFSPDDDCTRAQIVTFLYRYMGDK